MLYSKKHRFIFIHIPKTGGTSVGRAMRPYADIVPGLEDQRKYGHIKAIDLKKELGEREWNECYKFAVVRNPYEWFVSLYYFNNSQMREDIDDSKPFREWLYRQNPLLRQSDWIDDENGHCLLDDFIRFEQLNDDFRRVCRHIGLDLRLEHYLPTRRKHYTHYYDRSLKNYLNAHYRDELLRFNYRYRSGIRQRCSWLWKRTLPELTMKIALRTRMRRMWASFF